MTLSPSAPARVFTSPDVTIWHGDSRTAWQHLPEHSADAIITSPPYYGLRDYGVDGQLGLEATPAEYVETLADLLTGYGTRVLKPAGSLWLNLGDTYAGKANGGKSVGRTYRHDRADVIPARYNTTAEAAYKSLLMLPERVALALIDRGWIVRNKVIWAKPNGMPSSVTDRLGNKWEYLYHLVLQPRYYYDLDAIREPLLHPDAADGTRVFGGRNKAGAVGRVGGSGRVTDGLSRWGAQRRPDGHPPPRGSIGAGGAHRDHPNAYHPNGRNPGDYWQPPWTDEDDEAAAEVWSIATVPNPEAHFAMFPQELVRRPILATVPEQVCRTCGAGRERVTERSGGRWPARRQAGEASRHGLAGVTAGGGTAVGSSETHTVGWTDCGCGAGWQPGLALDPFGGAGTTAVMARRLGRRAALVELNGDYIHDHIAPRLRQDVLPFPGV